MPRHISHTSHDLWGRIGEHRKMIKLPIKRHTAATNSTMLIVFLVKKVPQILAP